MAIDNLSVPVDIPWNRLCVSEDMIDTDVCDRDFPYRWRSSVSVFEHTPPEEYQEYDEMTISYLKVACTITGFQPEPEEVGLTDRRVDSYWNDPAVIEHYKDAVNKYFGAYGAILEVAVSPQESDEWDPDEYPYIHDFDPKSRKLYELVSETGERMSRSLEDINVRRGAATTDTHEKVDVFKGFEMAGEGSGPGGAGGGGSWGFQSDWGTSDINKEEVTNVRTSERAREQRESFSHTTKLTQMYHQLNSYHLGTNRAVFFMLPRPHVVQSENTFVNGPRQLEGIQEFFLVVVRPEEMEDICVEAYLETAHVHDDPIYEYEKRVVSETIPKFVTAECIDLGGHRTRKNTSYNVVDDELTYTPPDGWEVDVDRNGGYQIEATGRRVQEVEVSEVERDHVTFYGQVESKHVDRVGKRRDNCKEGRLDLTYTIYLRKKEPDVAGYNKTLWLTGRGLCCGCPGPVRIRPGVVGEGLLSEHLSTEARDIVADGVIDESDELPEELSEAAVGGEVDMAISEANRLQEAIGRAMIEWINDSDRYPFETTPFTDTRFVGRTISGLLRTDDHPDNQVVADIAGIDQEVREKVAERVPNLERWALLEMPLAEMKDRFELTHEQAQHLHRAALGLEGPLPEPDQRWNAPNRRGDEERTVPNVVGLALDEARDAIDEAALFVDDETYQGNEQPRDTVLSQYPDAGETRPRGSQVDLVVSTGLSVLLPDVVGKSLKRAMALLDEAGLEAEPDIAYAPSDDQPDGHVVEITPDERTHVTPNASVALQLAGDGDAQGG